MASDIHVIPQNDLREHVDSRDCWCDPQVQIEHEAGCPAIADDESDWVLADYGECACDHPSAVVVVHHSMDGRELVEQHGLQ